MFRSGRIALFSVAFCTLLGCSGPAAPPAEPMFQHGASGQVLPWTHENFDAADDKFTFAVFSDLTGGERERIFAIRIYGHSIRFRWFLRIWSSASAGSVTSRFCDRTRLMQGAGLRSQEPRIPIVKDQLE